MNATTSLTTLQEQLEEAVWLLRCARANLASEEGRMPQAIDEFLAKMDKEGK